jgi:hypothetical protein
MPWRRHLTSLLDAVLRLIPEYLPEAAALANMAAVIYCLGYLAPGPQTVANGVTAQTVREVSWLTFKHLMGLVYACGSVVMFVAIVRERVAVREANRVEAEERKLLAQARISELTDEQR